MESTTPSPSKPIVLGYGRQPPQRRRIIVRWTVRLLVATVVVFCVVLPPAKYLMYMASPNTRQLLKAEGKLVEMD